MALPLLADRPEPAPAFLATVADEVTRETVRQAAAQFGWPAARVRDGGVAAACEILAGAAAPAVLLVDIAEAEDPLAAMDALADVCEPHTRVLAIGRINDIALYRRLMQMGVSDYLVKPVSAEVLTEALNRALRREAPAEPAPARPARIIAVIGARGGAGATSVAVSLAWGLAHERRQRTVLLDLDMQFGAAALSLDLEPGRGLREILTNPERIDGLLIGSAMVHQSEGLRILGAEEPLEEDLQVGPAGLQTLMTALAESCEAVVVDLPRRADRLTRDVLARADAVVLVTDLTLAGMRDSQRLLALLKTLGAKGELLVVANRVGGVAGEVPQPEFERGLGAGLQVLLPHDGKAAEAAAQEAKPLVAAARNAPLAAELRSLTDRLAGGEAAPPAAEKPSWMKRILGR
ncbi:AAA family ATPase [Phenylobacterium sp.]|uniref:AAA family ATPase n=1 Tax=Phenylobacterium sp. TaxID=1871053 RepID=UPI002FE3C24B